MRLPSSKQNMSEISLFCKQCHVYFYDIPTLGGVIAETLFYQYRAGRETIKQRMSGLILVKGFVGRHSYLCQGFYPTHSDTFGQQL